MRSRVFNRAWFAGIAAALLIAASLAGLVSAEEPATAAFQRTWARTDQPVTSGQANRTWMWLSLIHISEPTRPY